jgi:hypothetical protein
VGKSAYPVDTDVEAVLTAAGLALGTLDTATAALAGRHAFELETRRIMLAPAATNRRFDPPELDPAGVGFLDLGADVAVFNTLTYQPEGGSPTSLVVNRDFWLQPYNAPDKATPYTWIDLAGQHCRAKPLLPADRRSLIVNGRWGYSTTIPEDAWRAMVAWSVWSLLPEEMISLTGGKVSTQVAGVITAWGVRPLLASREEFARIWRQTTALYSRQ